MISDARAKKALTYLAETDRPCAEAKVNAERMEFKAKVTKQAIFKIGDGSVADRTAAADTSAEYGVAMEVYFTALQEYSHMANKRQTEAFVIEVWRSVNANRRHGS
jgi:hypothetical protein